MLLIQEQRLRMAAKRGVFQTTFFVDRSGGDTLVLRLQRGNGGPKSIYSALLLRLGMGTQTSKLLLGPCTESR